MTVVKAVALILSAAAVVAGCLLVADALTWMTGGIPTLSPSGQVPEFTRGTREIGLGLVLAVLGCAAGAMVISFAVRGGVNMLRRL